eukprot:CAMPEP_0202882876 /NCGR_PEP_ID=MMETSP1391-20130828/38610_1 /ASSEMBLY_ACC=CAM_ASM_000867 /TAXON_ID=1034604 /ORGANISM="Chlamydomonas leiostraca, Strain SAG 11-49" /LENGTH=171 /DNA_ID=CAMNT_0049565801 /DNA_START=152 /DNA_END=663 /DNA_ORIENTATION=+
MKLCHIPAIQPPAPPYYQSKLATQLDPKDDTLQYRWWQNDHTHPCSLTPQMHFWPSPAGFLDCAPLPAAARAACWLLRRRRPCRMRQRQAQRVRARHRGREQAEEDGAGSGEHAHVRVHKLLPPHLHVGAKRVRPPRLVHVHHQGAHREAALLVQELDGLRARARLAAVLP